MSDTNKLRALMRRKLLAELGTRPTSLTDDQCARARRYLVLCGIDDAANMGPGAVLNCYREQVANAETDGEVPTPRPEAAKPAPVPAPSRSIADIVADAPVTAEPDPADALAKAIRALTKGGAVDETTVNRLIEARMATVEAEILKQAAEKIEALQAPVRVIVEHVPGKPIPETKPAKVQHRLFPRLLDLVGERIATVMWGEAGSGKTTAAEMVAAELELPFYSVNSITDATMECFGYHQLHNGEYLETGLLKACRDGGVWCGDEFDGSLPNEAIRLNQILAAPPGSVVTFGSYGMVKRHANFVPVVTMNTPGLGASRDYSSRYQMDAATRDRFAMLQWDIDEALELEIAGPRRDWTRYVQSVRHAARKLDVRLMVTPRASIAGQKFLDRNGWTREAVEECFVWKGLPADEIKRIKLAMPS